MRLLSWVNMLVGLFLFFSLSQIASWDWFSSPESRLIVFCLGVLLMGNAIFHAFAIEDLWAQRK